MNGIQANYKLNNNKKDNLAIFASKGFINKLSSLITLEEKIRILFNDSFLIKTAFAQLNLKNAVISSNSNIILEYYGSKIIAQSFFTSKNNNIITLYGGVSAKINVLDFN